MLRDLRVPRLLHELVVAMLIVSRAPASWAQSDEQRAAARSLATEGAAAFNEARWKDAVDRFTRAEALVHAPPHLLFLARAYDKLGQLVHSREAYLKILREPLQPNAPPAFRNAHAAAEQELRGLEPRVANLTIKIQAPPEALDLQVLVNGTPLPSVLIGVARPTDPGEHRIEVLATGFRAKPETVRLGDGERRAIQLTVTRDPTAVLPADAVDPGRAPDAEGPLAPGAERKTQIGSPPASTAPREEPPQTPGGDADLRLGSYVAFGVGAVGLGVGSYFLARSSSKRADADDAYEECTASGDCRENDAAAGRTLELDGAARSALTVSIIGLSAGGVGLAVGTTLFLMSATSQEESSPTGVSIQPFVGFGHAGLIGTF